MRAQSLCDFGRFNVVRRVALHCEQHCRDARRSHVILQLFRPVLHRILKRNVVSTNTNLFLPTTQVVQVLHSAVVCVCAHDRPNYRTK